MDEKALKEKAKKVKEEIMSLMIDKNMNKMPNLKSIKSKKNELAKILTVLKQKQLLAELEAETNMNKEEINGK